MSDDPELFRLKKQAEAAKVSDVPAHQLMNSNVIVIFEGSKIYSAVATLASHKIAGAPVVDGSQRLVGVITEYDLLLQTSTKDVAEPITYIKDVVSVGLETTLQELILIFYKKKVRWLPVLGKDTKVEGIVTRIDVLSRLIKT